MEEMGTRTSRARERAKKCREARRDGAGKGTLERAVQHLYPLELSCDRENVKAPPQLNPEALKFKPRRDAAVATRYRIQDANIDAD